MGLPLILIHLDSARVICWALPGHAWKWSLHCLTAGWVEFGAAWSCWSLWDSEDEDSVVCTWWRSKSLQSTRMFSAATAPVWTPVCLTEIQLFSVEGKMHCLNMQLSAGKSRNPALMLQTTPRVRSSEEAESGDSRVHHLKCEQETLLQEWSFISVTSTLYNPETSWTTETDEK